MDFKIPSKEEVEAKMKEVLPEPKQVDVTFPEELQKCENFQMQLLEWDTKRFLMPQTWNLRPNRYPNIEALLAEVAELPIASAETFWENCRMDVPYPTPGVISDRAPFSSFFLGPEKEDAAVVDGKIVGRYSSDPFAYRGRTITPNNNHTWDISASHEMFVWEFGTVPTNPTVEWILRGDLYVYHEGRKLIENAYPRSGFSDPNLPNWKRPLSLLIDITSEATYGHAWLGLKQLGFWGGLDVAINFIEGVEWAYGVAEKPKYLSDTPSQSGADTGKSLKPSGYKDTSAAPSNDEASAEVETDPIVDAVSTIKARKNPKEFTKSGKPYVRVTSQEAGQKVSGKERDAAWKKVSKK